MGFMARSSCWRQIDPRGDEPRDVEGPFARLAGAAAVISNRRRAAGRDTGCRGSGPTGRASSREGSRSMRRGRTAGRCSRPDTAGAVAVARAIRTTISVRAAAVRRARRLRGKGRAEDDRGRSGDPEVVLEHNILRLIVYRSATGFRFVVRRRILATEAKRCGSGLKEVRPVLDLEQRDRRSHRRCANRDCLVDC